MNKIIIPYGKQNITDEDILEVIETLRSTHLTQGPKIEDFEDSFANYVGSKYAVAVSNGTAALHLACLSLGLKTGDRVITTPITFAASANCVRYCDAEVTFADIDPTTYLLDIKAVRSLLKNSPTGTYKGIIPVDFAGRAADLEALKELANEYGLWIIEDACHSPGGYFVESSGAHSSCGNGRFADISVFSFHPVKHIACGEGGMITTNDPNIYKELLRLRSHGITKGNDPYLNSLDFANSQIGVSEYPGWYMEMQQLGFNYRLTDIQASLGLSQLKRADIGLVRRKSLAKKYAEVFNERSYIYGHSGFIEGHAYHLYVIEVEDRLGLYNYLKQKGIYAQVHYIPCHLMPYYRDLGWNEGDLPHAENYYKKCLSLPMFPTLSDEEQQYVIDMIDRYYDV